MDVTPEGILVAVGWAVSLVTAIVFAFKVIPEMAARKMCSMFGLQRVKLENGRTLYAVEDLEGNPVKIPVGIKKDDDGNETVIYGYAPLPMTMTFLAAEQAALKVKMTLFNAKSQIQKTMNKEGLKAVMSEGGGLDAMLPFLPKKLQVAAAMAQALGLGRGVSGANSAQTPTWGYRHSPGGEK